MDDDFKKVTHLPLFPYSSQLRIIFPLLFSLFLTSSCFQLLAPANSVSVATGGKGCDSSATPFGTGSGTPNDPFQICSVMHLQNIQTDLSASYVLMANLDMTQFSYPRFTPIGLGSGAFTGIFDGNGLTIANWTAADLTTALGLFDSLDQNAVIRNLTLSNFNINSGGFVATLATHSTGSPLVDHITVTGATLQGLGNTNIGGILSYSVGTTLNQSTFNGQITQVGGTVGGLIGYAANTTVKYSSASVTINAIQPFAGGIIGNGANVAMSYSSASGSISSAGTFSIGSGGLMAWGTGSIDHSHSTVNINLPAVNYYYFGGLVGTTNFGKIIITSSYSDGTITLGAGANNVGGLIGYAGANSVLTDSYSASPILIPGNSSYSVGGIVGACPLQSVTIARVLSIGALNVVGAGAITGGLFNTPTGYPVSAAFWNSTTTGTNTDYASAGATSYTTASGTLFQQSTYAATGWDFTNTWYAPSPGVYPTLR